MARNSHPLMGAPSWALGLVVGAFVFGATLASRAQVLASQDLYLHISIGRWILANGRIPDHDVFSGSMPGAPWVQHEWLASVIWAFIYDHLGWGGLLGLAAFALALAVAVLTHDVSRSLGPIGAIAAALLAWGLTVSHVVARPQIVALPLIVIWMVAHVRARQGEGIPSWWLLPLMTLWANLHGSFMFGLGFSVLFALEAMFEADTRQRVRAAALRWSAFIGAALVAAMLTPHGPAGLLFPVQLLGMKVALKDIVEWDPSSLSNNAPLFFACLLLLFACLWRGVRLPLSRLAMLMLLLYMAFDRRRNSELLAFAAPVLLQHAIAEQVPAASPLTSWGAFARPAVRGWSVAIALCAAGVATLVLAWGAVRAPDRFTPSAALAAVEARGIQGPVLNSYNFGGYLIFRGYAPFIDGRADMYGDEFTAKYLALGELVALLERYRIAWTIFEPTNPRTAVMDALPGWKRVHADAVAVVHVRSPR